MVYFKSNEFKRNVSQKTSQRKFYQNSKFEKSVCIVFIHRKHKVLASTHVYNQHYRKKVLIYI